MANGEVVSWEQFDHEVKEKLNNVYGEIVLLTQTFASPSTTKLINEFSEKYGNVRHVVYDTVSEDAALDAFSLVTEQEHYQLMIFQKLKLLFLLEPISLETGQVVVMMLVMLKDVFLRMEQCRATFNLNQISLLQVQMQIKEFLLRFLSKKLPWLPFMVMLPVGASTSNFLAHIDDVLVKAARQLRKAGSKAVVVTGIPDADAQDLCAFH